MMEEINVTENMEERYNQNHDPRTGRFAPAGGAGGGGGASIWGAEHDQAMEVLSVSAYLKATGTAKTKNENVANMYAQNANSNFDFTVTKDGDGWIITSKAKDNRSLEYDEYDQMIDAMKQNRFNPNHDGKTGRFAPTNGGSAGGGGPISKKQALATWKTLGDQQRRYAKSQYEDASFTKGYAEMASNPMFGMTNQKLADAWAFIHPEYRFEYKIERQKGSIWTNGADIVHHRIYRDKR